MDAYEIRRSKKKRFAREIVARVREIVRFEWREIGERCLEDIDD